MSHSSTNPTTDLCLSIKPRTTGNVPWVLLGILSSERCLCPQCTELLRKGCCCCSHINSHNQVRGHRTSSSHSGAEEYPRKKTQTNQRWHTHISQLTQFMPPPETYKKQNRASAYDVPGPYWCTRLATRAWKNRLYRLPPKKDYHVYITRSACHYWANARQTQVNWKKETKKRKYKENKRQESEKRKRKGKERKGKERKDKKSKKRQDNKTQRREVPKRVFYVSSSYPTLRCPTLYRVLCLSGVCTHCPILRPLLLRNATVVTTSVGASSPPKAFKKPNPYWRRRQD